MDKPKGIVARLRDYDHCTDGDIDKAADILEFLLSQFQMHSPKMDGQHSYRFLNGGWPMTHLKGSSIEVAIDAAMAEIQANRLTVTKI